MKKIMFSDKYSLTKAVLEGRKTQTRRIVTDRLFQECRTNGLIDAGGFNDEWETKSMELLVNNSPYKIGEEVTIAQSYESMANEGGSILASMMQDETTFKPQFSGAGWKNKMFVRADLMPHRIKITNIRIERLQDISEEDCLKEGVCTSDFTFYYDKYFVEGIKRKGNTLSYKDENGWWRTFKWQTYETPQRAFASLIDKTCGKGTWIKNTLVFVYDFELIK